MDPVPRCGSSGDATENRSGCDTDERVRTRCLAIVNDVALVVGDGADADEESDGKSNPSLERLAGGMLIMGSIGCRASCAPLLPRRYHHTKYPARAVRANTPVAIPMAITITRLGLPLCIVLESYRPFREELPTWRPPQRSGRSR